MTGHSRNGLRGAIVAAAVALSTGLIVATASEAAPLAATPVEAVAGEAGATAVHWHRRHHHWGHHHHHRGWGHRRHRWGHHHHHRGWGHHHRRHHFY